MHYCIMEKRVNDIEYRLKSIELRIQNIERMYNDVKRPVMWYWGLLSNVLCFWKSNRESDNDQIQKSE